MATDACESRGLQLPALSAQTDSALRALLPPEASTRNPVDMIASASAVTYEQSLRLLLDDPNVDSVIVLFVPPVVTEAMAVAEAIRRAGAGSPKPVLTCFMGTHGVPPALSSLREGRFPSYAFPEAAAIALSRAVAYGSWRARPEGVTPAFPDVSPERARRALADRADGEPTGRWLDPDEVRDVLAAYGLRSPRAIIARDEHEAARAAESIGRPVAVKLVSPTITHKTDVGGVVLGVESPAATAEAFRAIHGRLAERGQANEMAGVLVQEMLPRGVETFVGVTQDPSFGPLIGFGLGGVNVEIMRDVVFRVHPITDIDAHDMIDQVRGVKLLDGYRGTPPADREALIDAILRVSRMVGDLPELLEMDINPLLAMAPGQGVVVVDARIRVRS